MIVGFPHRPGGGGPGSFQRRFENALIAKGHSVSYSMDEKNIDVIVIVGGTRRLLSLALARWHNVPIVHRLDGIGWIHRKQLKPSTIGNFIYGELANLIINSEHSFLSTKVVYQSEFVKHWWEKSGWILPEQPVVIYNGVCLEQFKPLPSEPREVRLICIEGTLDYSPFSVDLINELSSRLRGKIEFSIYGSFSSDNIKRRLHREVDFRGRLKPEHVAAAYQSSIYLSLDVNAACPNTVIEALACGAPVVGYDTGALKELVTPESRAGMIVPYGGNPWELEFPDVEALINAILQVKEEWEICSKAARWVAENRYGLDGMIARYMQVLNDARSTR